jgi:hypothetical protein
MSGISKTKAICFKTGPGFGEKKQKRRKGTGRGSGSNDLDASSFRCCPSFFLLVDVVIIDLTVTQSQSI